MFVVFVKNLSITSKVNHMHKRMRKHFPDHAHKTANPPPPLLCDVKLNTSLAWPDSSLTFIKQL